MRVCSDQGIRIIDAISLKDAFGQVFQIDLVDNADTRRHDLKTVERLHAPFQKLIPRLIALEFDLHISL